jgi:hypothetical protein
MTLASGSRPPEREKGEQGEEGRCRERAGACWATRSQGKGREKGHLGRAARGRKRRRREAVGQAARGEKGKEKEDREVGQPKREREGERKRNAMQMLLKLNLKFKFK